MTCTDTLFVVGPSLSKYRAQDTLDAVRKWSDGSCCVVFVSNTEQPLPKDGDAWPVGRAFKPGTDEGFMRGYGLWWAMDRGIQFRQAILMSATCLIVARGLDAWCAERLRRTDLGLMGVQAWTNYADAYKRSLGLLAEWGVPFENWDCATEVLSSSFLCLSASFADLLFGRGWLFPERCEAWPANYGAFLSWTAQMFGYYKLACGHVNSPCPPLYVALDTSVPVDHPAPMILHESFKLYCPVDRVRGYSEEEVRRIYAARRAGKYEDEPDFRYLGGPPV